MRKIVALGLLVALGAGIAVSTADEPPGPAQPQREHQWLQQLEGDWITEAEITLQPGEPPVTTTGAESNHLLGGFWSVGVHRGEYQGAPFTGIFTLGYDPEQNEYVGTWIDSLSSHLWTYEGTRDASGKALTLYTEGPCPQAGGKVVKLREVLEIVDQDHKLFTSEYLKDGRWVPGMTIRYKRVRDGQPGDSARPQ